MNLKLSLILLIFFYLQIAPVNSLNFTWTKLDTEHYKGKQDDIFFISENTGWYVNGYGKIFHTIDAGKTWQLQLEKQGTFFRCINFIDSLTGFVGTVGTDYFPNVTDTIALYKTTDGGSTWHPVSYKGQYVKGLCAIDHVKEAFVNHGELGYKHHIYCVGRVGSPANLLVSHDNGLTFTSMDMSKYCNALYDIKMMNKNEGFACASVGEDLEKSHAAILYTNDQGTTWKKVYESSRGYEISWKICFPSNEVGYATLQSYNPDSSVSTQRFIKTTNGGKKWREYQLCRDYKSRPFGIGFINLLEGYIGTMNTGYHTVDGGKTGKK